jgi:glyoxylase I family protein
MTRAHHTAICTTAARLDDSLRFWRDGLGFEVLMDAEFDGGWRQLFAAPSDHLRSIFLGDPSNQGSGIVELVDLGDLPEGAARPAPEVGFFLVSVYVGSVDSALARLGDLGLGGAPSQIEVHGVPMAVVRDPNGVRVELIGLPG